MNKDKEIISKEKVLRNEIKHLIDAFWASADPEEKIWLKIELKRIVKNRLKNGSMDNK